jgi:hypothetical protein
LIQAPSGTTGHITRWRPLIQWLLAVPQLMVAEVLSSLRGVLTLISLFTVLFTKTIPRPLFDVIAMTYRYEWRAMSYALFLHEDYPPFDFQPAATDDGGQPRTTLSLTYPEHLDRWKPLYKWFLARSSSCRKTLSQAVAKQYYELSESVSLFRWPGVHIFLVSSMGCSGSLSRVCRRCCWLGRGRRARQQRLVVMLGRS